MGKKSVQVLRRELSKVRAQRKALDAKQGDVKDEAKAASANVCVGVATRPGAAKADGQANERGLAGIRHPTFMDRVKQFAGKPAKRIPR